MAVRRDDVITILSNLALAHDTLSSISQCYRRDKALRLVEEAHMAASKLIIEDI